MFIVKIIVKNKSFIYVFFCISVVFTLVSRTNELNVSKENFLIILLSE